MEYRNQASRYEQTVFEKVEKELIEKSNSALFLLYTEQLQNLMKKCTQLFVETFEVKKKKKFFFSFFFFLSTNSFILKLIERVKSKNPIFKINEKSRK